MIFDAANTPTLMFGIIRRTDHEPEYRLVFFDLLGEEEAEQAFEDLLRHEVIFSGYTPVDSATPSGLSAVTLGRIRDVVNRLNRGEQLTEEMIGRELASITV
jgi:hypothetical protein